MFCSNCGAEMPQNAVFCSKCGTKLVKFKVNDNQDITGNNNQVNYENENAESNETSYETIDNSDSNYVTYNNAANNEYYYSDKTYSKNVITIVDDYWDSIPPEKRYLTAVKILVGVVATVVLVLLIICYCAMYSSKKSAANKSAETSTEVAESITSDAKIADEEIVADDNQGTSQSVDNVSDTVTSEVTMSVIAGDETVKNEKEMSVGDICKDGNLFIGLTYVKRANQLNTGWGEEAPSEGHEVIVAYFDIYNDSDKLTSWSVPDTITCYADGVQVGDVETFAYIHEDGISNYSSQLDENTQMMTCQDFEVPIGWNEIQIFYGSHGSWTIKSDEISNEPFDGSSLYKVEVNREDTNVGDLISDGDYKLYFDGIEFYEEESYSWNLGKYVIFKYRIENTTSSEINMSLMGYEMRAYENNYVLDGSDYVLNEKFDGHINIYDVEDIAAGMSANVYVAFECDDFNNDFYMVFDDSYIANNIVGSVYVSQGNVN